MKARLTEEQVKELYNKADVSGKALLDSIFGTEAFIKRPLGVWCLDSVTQKLVGREYWNDALMEAQGVVVVTEEMAFVVAPHHTVAAQWSARNNGDNNQPPLITDTDSIDASLATARIWARYKDAHHVDPDGDSEYDFAGSPAADFCRSYSCGNRGRGSWCLPTVKQLQAIAKNIKDVNACFMAMGCPTVPIGWYWSSIACENNECRAWYVYIYDGGTRSYRKYGSYYVRAVSAFQI